MIVNTTTALISWMSTECIRINFYFYLCLLSYFRKTSHHKTQCHVDLSAVTSSSCVYRFCLALCISSIWTCSDDNGGGTVGTLKHTSTFHLLKPEFSQGCVHYLPLAKASHVNAWRKRNLPTAMEWRETKRTSTINNLPASFQDVFFFHCQQTDSEGITSLGIIFFHRQKEIEISWRQQYFLLAMKIQKGQYYWGQPEVKEWFWSKPEEKERVPKI